ncbi:MAG: hypothetical protein ABSG01_07985 [Anaerolineales bacterium]
MFLEELIVPLCAPIRSRARRRLPVAIRHATDKSQWRKAVDASSVRTPLR